MQTAPVLGPRARQRPAREAALDDAFASFAVLMRAFREDFEAASKDDRAPDPRRVAAFAKITDTYSKLVRTDMLHDQHTSPEELSDEELARLAPEALKVLGDGEVEIG